MGVSRNEPCPCGSGKKFKKCCLLTGGVEEDRRNRNAAIAAAVVLAIALVVGFTVGQSTGWPVAVIGLLLVAFYRIFTDPPPPRTGGDPSAIRFGG